MATQVGTPMTTTALWTPGGVVAGQPAAADPALSNPLRLFAFKAALALIFLRYSLLHELVANYAGSNGYILFVFAIPALLGVIASGGIQRTLATKPAKYWLIFIVLLILAVPFSFWKGESFQYAWNYLRTDMPMLFVMGGLALTWKECRSILTTIAVAGICNIAVGLLVTKSYGDRTGLNFGIVSNPNDYAGHLLFIVPVVFYLVMFPPFQAGPLRTFFRLASLVSVLAALMMILLTGSRGAFIALGVGAVYLFFKSSVSVRLISVVTLPLVFLALFAVVPRSVRSRLEAIDLGTSNGNQNVDEAEESSRLRRHLLDESIKVTFQHPLLGVGPGQFGNYEGRTALWLSSHNSFTEISSECGIPAFGFFLSGMLGSFWMLQRTWKRAKLRPQFKEIAVACYCLSLAFVMFCSAIFFLNFAYFFYLPAAIGLFVVISTCAQKEFALAESKETRMSAPPSPSQIAPAPPLAAAVPQLSVPKRAVRFNGFR